MTRRLLIAIAVTFAVGLALAEPARTATVKRLQLYGRVVELRIGSSVMTLGANGSDITSTGRLYFRPSGTAADAYVQGANGQAAHALALNPNAQATSADVLRLDADSPSAPTLVATQTGSGYAGYFTGNVQVVGNLVITQEPKPVLLDRPDGPLMLFGRESPLPYFQDVGVAALVDGRATVTLDATFVETIEPTDDYAVFLTPQDGTGAVAVADRQLDRFTILGSGAQQVAYEIVAVRRGFADQRFTLEDTRP